MKNLDFSPDLKIPAAVVTQKLAFLGISGSGKTYGATKLVEELLVVTKIQLATLSGMKHTSGTFSTYLGRLSSARFIERAEDGKRIRPTQEGIDFLDGDYPEPLRGPALLETWKQKMVGGCRRMLEVIVAAGEHGIHKDKLAEAVEMSASSGTFSTYMGRLSSNGLVYCARGSKIVTANEELLS
jgi:hypothetical protein